MSKKNKKSEILSFVIIGSFNPQIFHPSWFLNEQLISKATADTITVSMNSTNITILKNDWFSMEVTNQTLKIQSNQEAYYEMIRDLVVGIFHILSNTPTRAFGINTSVNIEFDRRSDLLNSGKEFLNIENCSKFLDKPQLKNISIDGEKKNTNYKGFQKVTIQPSIEIEGLFIDVNDHFDLSSDSQFETIWKDKQDVEFVRGDNISKILLEEFSNSIDNNKATLVKIIDLL